MKNIDWSHICWSLGIVVITVFILSFIKRFLIKRVAYTNKAEQKANTFLGIIFNCLQYLVVLLAAIIILKINGIDVTSLLAGLGIVATIVGLSLQDTLKDVFSGINIYNNNFYKVGDIVLYEGNKCEVKYFSARVTKFKNCFTNSTYTVNNSNITAIEKIKGGQAIFITFEYSDPKDQIDMVFNNTIARLKDDETIRNVGYLGVVELTDGGVKYALTFEAPARDVAASARIYAAIYDELAKIKLAPNTNDGVRIKKDGWI